MAVLGHYDYTCTDGHTCMKSVFGGLVMIVRSYRFAVQVRDLSSFCVCRWCLSPSMDVVLAAASHLVLQRSRPRDFSFTLLSDVMCSD